MRFLADMGVDIRVVQWLRAQGHDATHLRDEGLHRLANGDIFKKAMAEERVILTFDLDFGEIAALSKGRTARIIVFRLHNTRTNHVIDRLRTRERIVHRQGRPDRVLARCWTTGGGIPRSEHA